MEAFSDAEQTAQLVTEIVVPDLDRTLASLVRLGFALDRRTSEFAVLRWEHSLLFIAHDRRAALDHRWINVRVMVPDVDAVWSQVIGAEVKIVSAIGDRDYGLRDFTIAVPGAVEIRFAQALQR